MPERRTRKSARILLLAGCENALSIPWDYEKEGFDLPFGAQDDDQMISPGIWFEIKPEDPDSATQSNECIYSQLGEMTRRGVVLTVNLPEISLCRGLANYEICSPQHQMYEFWPWWDNSMMWMCCPSCRAVKIDYCESNYMHCPKCGTSTSQGAGRIVNAIEAARSARFEFGERGTQ